MVTVTCRGVDPKYAKKFWICPILAIHVWYLYLPFGSFLVMVFMDRKNISPDPFGACTFWGGDFRCGFFRFPSAIFQLNSDVFLLPEFFTDEKSMGFLWPWTKFLHHFGKICLVTFQASRQPSSKFVGLHFSCENFRQRSDIHQATTWKKKGWWTKTLKINMEHN